MRAIGARFGRQRDEQAVERSIARGMGAGGGEAHPQPHAGGLGLEHRPRRVLHARVHCELGDSFRPQGPAVSRMVSATSSLPFVTVLYEENLWRHPRATTVNSTVTILPNLPGHASASALRQ